MQKDNLVYVGHMLDTAEKAVQKVVGIDRAAYDADENLRLALAHLVQTIGEAQGGCQKTFSKRIRPSHGRRSSESGTRSCMITCTLISISSGTWSLPTCRRSSLS